MKNVMKYGEKMETKTKNRFFNLELKKKNKLKTSYLAKKAWMMK